MFDAVDGDSYGFSHGSTAAIGAANIEDIRNCGGFGN
jgi:hypothetical protein